MIRLLALLAAQTLFLWMFLAASPLEQLADAGPSALRPAAYEFATEWRHGMAGNSPLYMPGFFAVAIATWYWAASRRLAPGHAQAIVVLPVSLGLAWLGASAGARRVLWGFALSARTHESATIPAPAWSAVLAGTFTLLTWSLFVVASQRALARRSWRPLGPVPLLAAVLMAVRPWTVGDFTGLWVQRALDGSPAAIASWLAIPVVSAVLVRHEIKGAAGPGRPSECHRVQTARSGDRTGSQNNPPPTSTAAVENSTR